MAAFKKDCRSEEKGRYQDVILGPSMQNKREQFQWSISGIISALFLINFNESLIQSESYMTTVMEED